ncbi:hypothetical protein GQ53DRAFT_746568 [Thozetella sp. PMI_491]|nr:hypothetical protein GQ53DRAFT_746568 [Thozetella sp. PMI_491]
MRSASSDEVKLFLDKKQMERIEKHIEAKDKDARVLQRELEPLLKLVKDHKPELKEEGQIPVEKEGVYIMWLACAIEACRVQGSLAGALKSRRLTAEERESEVKGKEKELRKELGLDAYADMLEKKFAEKLEEPDQKSNGLDQQSKGHDQKTVGEDRITEEQQTKVTTKEDFDLKPLEEKVENIKKNVERIKKTRLDARMERKGDQKQVEPRNPLEEYVQSKIRQT